jgi:hypothetical protein
MEIAVREGVLSPGDFSEHANFNATVQTHTTKIDPQGLPYTEYLLSIERNYRDGSKSTSRAKVCVNEFIDVLMYHCACYNEVGRIPAKLHKESDSHGVPG